MKRAARWTWLFAGVVAVVVGVWGYRRVNDRVPDSVEVRPRELVQTIVSSGQVMPPAEVRLDRTLDALAAVSILGEQLPEVAIAARPEASSKNDASSPLDAGRASRARSTPGHALCASMRKEPPESDAA